MKPIVKICGITRVQDAQFAAALGADFLGLNLFPKSPRSLTLSRAREIADAVRGRVGLVGVFVNVPTPQVMAAMDLIGLDLAQLHGDEWPDEVQALGRRAIKVFRSLPVTPSQLARFPSVWGYLVDTPNPKLFGGTGVVWDWSSLRAVRSPRPMLVAGGISPENARRALAESGATGLDVNSGVEAAPGVKDAGKLRRLFEELHDLQV
ncbi:MAG: N-(5'-phosphoribosyl)anthranilate isomerase [Thermoanaerobaculia bacterium]